VRHLPATAPRRRMPNKEPSWTRRICSRKSRLSGPVPPTRLVLFGTGEPLLSPRILGNTGVARIPSRTRKSLTRNSNGTLLTQPADRETSRSPLSSISISLDAPPGRRLTEESGAPTFTCVVSRVQGPNTRERNMRESKRKADDLHQHDAHAGETSQNSRSSLISPRTSAPTAFRCASSCGTRSTAKDEGDFKRKLEVRPTATSSCGTSPRQPTTSFDKHSNEPRRHNIPIVLRREPVRRVAAESCGRSGAMTTVRGLLTIPGPVFMNLVERRPPVFVLLLRKHAVLAMSPRHRPELVWNNATMHEPPGRRSRPGVVHTWSASSGTCKVRWSASRAAEQALPGLALVPADFDEVWWIGLPRLNISTSRWASGGRRLVAQGIDSITRRQGQP